MGNQGLGRNYSRFWKKMNKHQDNFKKGTKDLAGFYTNRIKFL